MDAAGDGLAQDATAAAILACMSAEPGGIVRLTGPPGSGKTWTARRVAMLWQDQGGTALFAQGDDYAAQRALNPFLFALMDRSLPWRRLLRKGARDTVGVAEQLAGSPGAAGSLFDLLATAVDQKFERATRPLSGAEREILDDLRRIAKRRPLLLVADNAHWWDATSISLLVLLRSAALREAIPELNRLTVLLVDTLDHQESVDERGYRHLIERVGSPFRLELVGRTDFGSALRALGLSRQLDPNTFDLIYRATGAHLKLCEQLVALIEADNAGDLDRLLNSDVVNSTLSARLNALGRGGAEMANVLSAAALIGLRFNLRQLACLLDLPLDELVRILHRAEATDLVCLESDTAFFAHDLLRGHFLGRGSDEDRRRKLVQLANCLRLLKPAQYEVRGRLLLEAGDRDAARELAALGAIQRIRDGSRIGLLQAELERLFPADQHLSAFVEEMAGLYRLLATGEYGQALKRVSAADAGEGQLMAAERCYLMALCWLEQQTRDGFTEARTILQQWRPRLEDEPELSIRFGLLLQQALVLSEEFDAARALEKELHAELNRRASFDDEAAKTLQIQNRRSAGVTAAEVAEVRIQRSVAFFRMPEESTRVRYPIEFYKALNNHAAILLTLGREEEAMAAATEAETFILTNSELSFPRKDVLAHNMTIGSYRLGGRSLHELVSQQWRVCESVDGASDNFLQRCTLGALMLLAGDVEGARTKAAELRQEIEVGGFSERYLLYYEATLHEAIAIHEGDWNAAEQHHLATQPIVSGLHWTSAPYVRKRHTLIRSLIEARPTGLGTGSTFDMALIDRAPVEVGSAWRHYGRLSPMCDLSFWIDS